MQYTSENKETIYKGKDKEGVLKNFWVDDHSIITLAEPLSPEELVFIFHKFQLKNGVYFYETNAEPFYAEGLKVEFTIIPEANKIIVRPDLTLLFHKGFAPEDVLAKANEQLMNMLEATIKKAAPIKHPSVEDECEPTDLEVIVLEKPLTKAQFKYLKENGRDECEGKCFSYETGTDGPFNCEGLTMYYEFNADNSMITVSFDPFAKTSSGLSEEEILSYLKRQILRHVNYYVEEHANSLQRNKLKK
jgi:hypothetical protein